MPSSCPLLLLYRDDNLSVTALSSLKMLMSMSSVPFDPQKNPRRTRGGYIFDFHRHTSLEAGHWCSIYLPFPGHMPRFGGSHGSRTGLHVPSVVLAH